MITNEYGQVAFDTREVIDSLYQNIDLCRYALDDKEIQLYNENSKLFGLDELEAPVLPNADVYDYHKTKNENWTMPDHYQNIDIHKYLVERMQELDIMNTSYTNYLAGEIEQWNRLFPNGPEKLWKFLHYFMDVCKENDCVNGVGRGSSVSSLVLYLLGVHYIDPIKYNLHYKEFLR